MNLLINKAIHTLRQASLIFANAHTVTPDENHLEGLRRRFRSPVTHASVLLELFTRDPLFTKAMPMFQEDYLVTLALVGRELRANVYQLSQGDIHSVRQAWDPNWTIDGLFHFHLAPDKTITHLRRNTIPHLGYNPYDPCVSYVRPLTVAEEQELEGMFFKAEPHNYGFDRKDLHSCAS